MFDIPAMIAKRDEFLAAAAALDTMISTARDLERRGLLGVTSHTPPPPPPPRPEIEARPRQRAAATSSVSLTEDIALEMTKVFERPVTTMEITKEIQQRGIVLPGKNANNVVSARLSNGGRLKGRRGIGWWPVELPWPDEVGQVQIFDEDEGGADLIG